MQDESRALKVPNVTATPALVPEALAPKADQALQALIRQGSSENTGRSYRAALRYWAGWFQARFRQPMSLPVAEATVLQFVVDHAGRSLDSGEVGAELPADIDHALVAAGLKAKPGPVAIATLVHRMAVLSQAHVRAQISNPCHAPAVREALARAKRVYAKRGDAPRKKPALTRAPLEAVLATCDDTLRGKRDRALLLFAWASGGRRRSEVALARHEDLRCEEDGFTYTVGLSKTNQTGEPRPEDQKPIAGIAAHALEAWIQASSVSTGAIFRRITRTGHLGAGLSSSAVRDIVKAHCAAAGLDPTFSAHSLRSGVITEAGRPGVALSETMARSGQRSNGTI